MRFFRTWIGVLAGFVAALTPVVVNSQTQGDWPSKPVRVVVPFAPGGSADTVARILAQHLTKALGQPFLADNRPGASGNIGAGEVARSKPDGYTLLMGSTATNITNQFVMETMPYDTAKDFVPVTLAGRFPLVLVVSPSLGVRTLRELIDRARSSPGSLSYGHSGTGTLLNLSMLLLESSARIDLVAVPYKGSAPMLQDLIGGHIQLAIDQAVTTLPQIRAGKVIALGVTTTKPHALLPDVPPIANMFPGFEAVSLHPLMAPSGTPPSIIARLSRECDKILHSPEVVEQFEQLGAEAVGGAPAEVSKLLAAETEKWREVIKASGVKSQ